MIEMEYITLDKKELIKDYLSQRCTQNSEFTFTNLFMWRKSYDIRYAIINNSLCLMPKHSSGPRSATFPIGGTAYIKETVEELIDYFVKRDEEPLIRLYDDKSVQQLNELFPNKFIITEDINAYDYVYNVKDLINLSGKKYHGKKNHINKFKSLYNYEYSTMTPSDKEECLNLFDKWYESKKYEIAGVSEEREAVAEFLDNWKELDIVGGCIRVDGKMVAFSFGEPLCGCKNTVVIHLEHADTNYQGIYPMINQQFLEHEWSEFEYVNREEDMGLEGLRKAKQSYRPVFMVKKYVATLA